MCLSTADSYAQKSKKMSDEAIQLNLEYIFIEGIKQQITGNNAKALAEYIKAIEIDPENAAINFKIAQIYAEDEKAEKALLYITQSVKSEPSNKFYHIFKANVETAMGDFSAAMKTYNNMRENTSGYEDFLLEMAAIYYYASKLDDAFKIYEEAEAYYGIYEQITYQKQNILLKQNKLSQAIEEGEKLINFYPGVPEYVEHLVNIMASNGKSDEALDMIQTYIREFEGDANLEFLAAGILRSKGKHKEARPYLLSAFGSTQIEVDEKIDLFSRMMQKADNTDKIDFLNELSSIMQDAHQGDGLVLAAIGDWNYSINKREKALEYYQSALEFDKDNFQLWQNVLSILIDEKQYDKVIDVSEEALEYYPNQAVFYLYNGTSQLIKGRHKESVFMLEQGVNLSSNDLGLQNTFYAQLGDAYNGIKNYRKSYESYEKVLEIDPDNAHVLNNYSYFLALRKENLQKAKEMSFKLVKAYPKNPTYLDTHAWVLYQLGEYQSAKKYLEKAASNTKSCTIFEHYGDVLFKLGDIEEAVKQWEKGTELGNCSKNIEKKIADKKLYE